MKIFVDVRPWNTYVQRQKISMFKTVSKLKSHRTLKFSIVIFLLYVIYS